MSNEDNKSALHDVLAGLMTGIEATSREKFKAVSTLPVMETALQNVQEGDFDGFYYSLIYPLSQMIDGLLSSVLPKSQEAQFLFKHYRFVECHFQELIRKTEGNTCCADKSHTVMLKLLAYFLTGETVAFDYGQKYTFHLPKNVFTSHEEIISFFKGLHSLYYGNPQNYIEAYARIAARLQPSSPQ